MNNKDQGGASKRPPFLVWTKALLKSLPDLLTKEQLKDPCEDPLCEDPCEDVRCSLLVMVHQPPLSMVLVVLTFL